MQPDRRRDVLTCSDVFLDWRFSKLGGMKCYEPEGLNFCVDMRNWSERGVVDWDPQSIRSRNKKKLICTI
jgi:hypothetical protein